VWNGLMLGQTTGRTILHVIKLDVVNYHWTTWRVNLRSFQRTDFILVNICGHFSLFYVKNDYANLSTLLETLIVLSFNILEFILRVF